MLGKVIDKENNNVSGNILRSSNGSQQKSLIPVLVSPSVSPKNENSTVSTTPASVSKGRRPLGQIQCKGTPAGSNVVGKLAPKSSKIGTNVKVDKPTERLSSAGIQSKSDGAANTPHNSPSAKLKAKKKALVESKSSGQSTSTKSLKNLKDADVGQESDSIAYWKDLAESRRKALDDALKENYELHKRIEELENDNAELQDVVREAEKLALMISDVADEEINLDESGIGETAQINSSVTS